MVKRSALKEESGEFAKIVHLKEEYFISDPTGFHHWAPLLICMNIATGRKYCDTQKSDFSCVNMMPFFYF